MLSCECTHTTSASCTKEMTTSARCPWSNATFQYGRVDLQLLVLSAQFSSPSPIKFLNKAVSWIPAGGSWPATWITHDNHCQPLCTTMPHNPTAPQQQQAMLSVPMYSVGYGGSATTIHHNIKSTATTTPCTPLEYDKTPHYNNCKHWMTIKRQQNNNEGLEKGTAGKEWKERGSMGSISGGQQRISLHSESASKPCIHTNQSSLVGVTIPILHVEHIFAAS